MGPSSGEVCNKRGRDLKIPSPCGLGLKIQDMRLSGGDPWKMGGVSKPLRLKAWA
jgi:hypothetical protein